MRSSSLCPGGECSRVSDAIGKLDASSIMATKTKVLDHDESDRKSDVMLHAIENRDMLIPTRKCRPDCLSAKEFSTGGSLNQIGKGYLIRTPVGGM